MHTPQFVHVYPAWFWPSVLLRSSIGFAWTDCLVRSIKIPNLHGQIPFGCANLNEGVQTECCLSAILEGLWEAASIGTSPEAEAAESNEVNCLPGNTKEGAHQEISKRKRTPVWLTWVLEIQTDNGGWPREDKEKLVGQGGGGGESTKPGAWLTCKDNQLQTQNSWDRITQMCALDQAWGERSWVPAALWRFSFSVTLWGKDRRYKKAPGTIDSMMGHRATEEERVVGLYHSWARGTLQKDDMHLQKCIGLWVK